MGVFVIARVVFSWQVSGHLALALEAGAYVIDTMFLLAPSILSRHSFSPWRRASEILMCESRSPSLYCMVIWEEGELCVCVFERGSKYRLATALGVCRSAR